MSAFLAKLAWWHWWILAAALAAIETVWKVKGPDLPAKARVRVVDVEGAVLVVTGA